MSHLTVTERAYLEKLFAMNSGYVLNFSDSTLGHFFSDTIDIDIHAQKFQSSGTSKAKKLREFWRLEPDHLAGKSIAALIGYMEANPPSDGFTPDTEKLIARCKAISHRLLSGTLHLDHLKEAVTVFGRQIPRRTNPAHGTIRSL
jgi:hypothetical protein